MISCTSNCWILDRMLLNRGLRFKGPCWLVDVHPWQKENFEITMKQKLEKLPSRFWQKIAKYLQTVLKGSFYWVWISIFICVQDLLQTISYVYEVCDWVFIMTRKTIYPGVNFLTPFYIPFLHTFLQMFNDPVKQSALMNLKPQQSCRMFRKALTIKITLSSQTEQTPIDIKLHSLWD